MMFKPKSAKDFPVSSFSVDLGSGYVMCGVCERRCLLKEGEKGYCGNRVNINGKIHVIGYGILSAIESRPIEIKPLFHFWPNSTALTFSNWGCNFHCPWCQNYHLSFQTPDIKWGKTYSPEKIVKMALRNGDEGLCASFNEPTTQLEYLVDVFKLAKKRGLYNTIVSNGYMTFTALEALHEAGLDGLNFDIKGCYETYNKFIGALNPMIVFRNAKRALDLGIHVEMVYLMITKANDWDECLRWILKRHVDLLGKSVPLHINRYYPAWKYYEPPTDINKLIMAYNIAKEEYNIEYIYIGNIGDWRYETTYCPKCGKPLIIRTGYRVLEYRVTNDNKCPYCGYKINIVGKYVKNKMAVLPF